MVWLEVETKAKIHNVNEFRKKVKKIAVFKKKEKRGDDYFALRRKGYPKKAFRVRNTKTEHVVNFKKWDMNLWSKDIVVKHEYEFSLPDKDKLDNFLALVRDLGFVEWVKKRKTSESYRYKKNKRVVIEINKIEHLGYFLEIEYLCQRKELMKAKKLIRQALKELGVTKKDINNTGYTKMLWDRGIKDKKYFIK
jgi:predicted adenylyl cyclase CyaB